MPTTSTKSTKRTTSPMTVDEVQRELEGMGKEQYRKIFRRHGAGEKLYGVNFADIGKLTKRIKRDHGLAEQLWASGWHEARILATTIADPARMTARTLDAWAATLTNYGEVGAFASFAAGTEAARDRMEAWTASDDEWVGSAGWTLLAHLAAREGVLSDAELAPYLATIERDIHDRKNRVRQAMNSALIAIGVRNPQLEAKALAAAKRIGTVEVDHGETECKTADATEYIKKTVAYRRERAAVQEARNARKVPRAPKAKSGR